MQSDAALLCRRLQLRHSSCILSGRRFDWVCNGRHCKPCILYTSVCVCLCWGCWQEWKTAFGGVWAHASVYRIYWDVWSCVEMCEWEHGRSTEVYKSNRMIVLPLWSTLSQQVHSSFFPFFFISTVPLLPSISLGPFFPSSSSSSPSSSPSSSL